MKPVEQVLKDAGVKKDEIDDVGCSLCSLLTLDCPRWWFYPYPQSPATAQGVFQRQGTV